VAPAAVSRSTSSGDDVQAAASTSAIVIEAHNDVVRRQEERIRGRYQRAAEPSPRSAVRG
jgi:hypothetical protein